MSNETDLDWLARNVHEWPINAEFAVRPGMGEVLFYEHHYSHLAQVSRDQWLARRAELQNKPSWEGAPELVGAVAEVFQPLTSIEDNQEQDMTQKATEQQSEKQQDNSWFERGELPPAGVECEIHHQKWNDGKFERVQIAAITREYLIVDDGKHEQHYLRKNMSFRPIITDRELLIDAIVSQGFLNKSGDVCGQIADAVIAAGFKLGAP